MFTPTHFIISMKAGLTKGSQSKMWRCITKDGERVNIFQHTDPNKNTFSLFEDAGYGPFMVDLVENQEITWNEFPIPVFMVKDGQWWDIQGVAPAQDTRPDHDNMPDLALYRSKAAAWANYILTCGYDVILLDTETTGVDPDDEIVSLAISDSQGQQLVNTLIRPTDLTKLDRVKKGGSASQINGITAEMLKDAPTFAEAYDHICAVLDGKLWVIYNAPFDTRMIEQDCLRAGLVPPVSVGINDAMVMFSQWNGEWSPIYKNIVSKKLEVAAQQFGIEQPNAHDAMADVLTTLAVVRAMALHG